ncbi:MAG: hypothetical protein RIF46_05110 [Cyclobacteriaceae bacterium]
MEYKYLFEAEYAAKELIFIGERINDGGDSYEMRVIEVLKGNQKLFHINGDWGSSCSLVPRKTDGLWIVYANIENGRIDIEDCGLSRPIHSINVTPDPPRKGIKNEVDVALNVFEKISHAEYLSSIQIKEEIAELRKRRDN